MLTLQELTRDLDPTTQISICESKAYTIDPRSKEKVFNAFYVGTIKDAPSESLTREVEKTFTSFMWNTKTYILKGVEE